MGICAGVAPSDLSQQVNLPEIFARCKAIVELCGINDWSLCIDAQTKGFVADLATASAYKDGRVVIVFDSKSDSFVVQEVTTKKVILGKAVSGEIVSDLMQNGVNIDAYRQHIVELAQKIGVQI